MHTRFHNLYYIQLHQKQKLCILLEVFLSSLHPCDIIHYSYQNYLNTYMMNHQVLKLQKIIFNFIILYKINQARKNRL